MKLLIGPASRDANIRFCFGRATGADCLPGLAIRAGKPCNEAENGIRSCPPDRMCAIGLSVIRPCKRPVSSPIFLRSTREPAS